ncbi:MAG: group II truncated hemoglobin [Methyloprofundus sp.]|nr:group II truncated hemoglobin [Methyloprofundus sp.]
MTQFGTFDASYEAAGKEVGVRKLVDEFYRQMETLTEGQHIRAMHKEDLGTIKDKLALFLMGWLGGPRLYPDKYGSISIPQAHQHLVINEQERDAWLLCMKEALKVQDYSDDFKQYLIQQLAIPAERIRLSAKS